MEMHLQPLATNCFVSGQPFGEGDRVASYLVRPAANQEVLRYDLLESQLPGFATEGFVVCRWVHPFKPRSQQDNSDRALKLSAESLFLTLADPATELNAESTRLVQFLALMMERKKVLKPRGRSADGAKNVYEHAKTKQLFEVPAGELTPEFFVAVQEQLSVLVGAPKPKAAVAGAPPAAPPPAAAPEPPSPVSTK
jgi:hypothetical protein